MPPVISKEEQEARRRAVIYHRADFRLEGIEEPPEITRLSDQFISGQLTPAQYREACFAFAKSLAAEPNWTPITGKLPE